MNDHIRTCVCIETPDSVHSRKVVVIGSGYTDAATAPLPQLFDDNRAKRSCSTGNGDALISPERTHKNGKGYAYGRFYCSLSELPAIVARSFSIGIADDTRLLFDRI